MRPKGTEDVKYWKANESRDFVGRIVEDCMVAGNKRCVSQNGGFGKTGGAAGKIESCRGSFGGFDVRDYRWLSGFVREEGENAE